uniref:SFRICE_005511 n=1 Tax=Spodoptera frugiperda TaxID=7108 RepID=A0A2H1VVC0_SPOFR
MSLPEAQLTIIPFSIFPNTNSPTTLKFPTPKKAGNTLVTPPVFKVSIGGSNCLPSGDPSALWENHASALLGQLDRSDATAEQKTDVNQHLRRDSLCE